MWSWIYTVFAEDLAHGHIHGNSRGVVEHTVSDELDTETRGVVASRHVPSHALYA